MSEYEIKVLVPPSPHEDALSVRTRVFQEEQHIDQGLDFDGNDDTATHVVVYEHDEPVGTGRIRTVAEHTAKIERVAVLSKMRGKGIGKMIMKTIDDHLQEIGTNKATLDAQYHAKDFYQTLGFEQEGDIFEEVGIPHIIMSKSYK